MKPHKTFDAKDRKSWPARFAEHHATQDQVWLFFETERGSGSQMQTSLQVFTRALVATVTAVGGFRSHLQEAVCIF